MKNNNVFEQENSLKMYLGMVMPVVVGMLISIVYNVADTFFISMTQNTNLVAGVSVCAPLFMIAMSFGNIYGQGGTSVISRLFGQGQLNETKAVSSYCFYMSIVTGILLGAVMFVFQDPLLHILGADAETIGYARPYYLTMALGAPFLVENFIHINILRAEGMSMESTIGSTIGILCNVILDPIFILLLGWGSFGAALASVLGYVVSDVILVCIVLKKSRILSIQPSMIRIRKEHVSQIFLIGISAAITNWMSSICMIITNQFLLPYGNDQIAAMGIAMKLIMIPQMIAAGMVFGAAPIIGYFYGGGRYLELKEIMKMILRIVMSVIISISAVIFLGAKAAVGIFLKDAIVMSSGALMIRFQIATIFLGVFVMFATVCFQAAGMATEALVVSVLRQGVIFLVIIFLAEHFLGYYGIVAAQSITDVITAIVVGYIFYRQMYRKLSL